MTLFETRPDIKRFSEFPLISLDVGQRNGPQLINALNYKGKGFFYDDIAGELLASRELRIPQLPKGKEEIIKLPLKYIGISNQLKGRGGYETIVEAVGREGLRLCSKVAAPETAVQIGDFIKEGERTKYLSDPMTDKNGILCIFGLNCRGGMLELDGGWVDGRWNPDDLVVCRLR